MYSYAIYNIFCNNVIILYIIMYYNRNNTQEYITCTNLIYRTEIQRH